MKLHNFLILVAAVGGGIMYFKSHPALLSDDDSDVPYLSGHGSLMESIQAPGGNGSGFGGVSGGMSSRNNSYAGGKSGYRAQSNAPVQPEPQSDLPLLEAAAKGNKAAVEERLAAHALIDSRDSLRRTPLMFAAWNGHDDVSAWLLAAGANIGLEDRHGNNALDYAAGRGLSGSVAFLLAHAHAEDDNHYLEYAALIQAAYAGDAAKLPPGDGKLASVNRVNPEDQAPLDIVAGNGALPLAEALLRRGAEVNIAGAGRQTPLHWASWNNQPAMIAWLLDKGAGIEARDLSGNTALIFAAENNRGEAVKLLLERGADKYAANKEGKTAGIIADDKGFKDLAELLK